LSKASSREAVGEEPGKAPAAEVAALEGAVETEEVGVAEHESSGASPGGGAEPPVPGSCEEPSKRGGAAREVETLEVVEAVVLEECFFTSREAAEVDEVAVDEEVSVPAHDASDASPCGGADLVVTAHKVHAAASREAVKVAEAAAAAIEEVVVPVHEASEASPGGGAEPPVPGSCVEPSAKEGAAREVETLEVVKAVVPEEGCCKCADWQAAKRYLCLKKDPPMTASLPACSTGAPKEAGGKPATVEDGPCPPVN
jgi:hypothetical protein